MVLVVGKTAFENFLPKTFSMLVDVVLDRHSNKNRALVKRSDRASDNLFMTFTNTTS